MSISCILVGNDSTTAVLAPKTFSYLCIWQTISPCRSSAPPVLSLRLLLFTRKQDHHYYVPLRCIYWHCSCCRHVVCLLTVLILDSSWFDQTWFDQIKKSTDISLRNSPGTPSSFWPFQLSLTHINLVAILIYQAALFLPLSTREHLSSCSAFCLWYTITMIFSGLSPRWHKEMTTVSEFLALDTGNHMLQMVQSTSIAELCFIGVRCDEILI